MEGSCIGTAAVRGSGKLRPLVFLALIALGLLSCRSQPGREAAPPSPLPTASPAPGAALPEPRRELRALWVASFMGIDWPKSPSTDPGTLSAGIEAIAELARSSGLNAIFLQVRPAGDAIYPTDKAPWSSWLTGKQGLAPEGGFDPLAAWILACRSRGLRLYAWMNPFRAGAPSISAYAENSLPRLHPDWILDLGKPGYLWLDPGNAQAREAVIEAAVELAGRYDLDGLVIDDYFYPYPEQRPDLAGPPDDASWARYQAGGGKLEREAWRRENVDSFVRDLGQALRRASPGLPFGVSPFGIAGPDEAQGIRGKDAAKEQWADARAWLSRGWVDFLSPQLYWPVSQSAQSFPLLLRQWEDANLQDRVLAPSLRLSQPGTLASERGTEMLREILVERAMRRAGGGFAFYSATALADLSGPGPLPDFSPGPLVAQVAVLSAESEPPAFAKLLSERALVPAMDWLGGSTLPPPACSLKANDDGSFTLSLSCPGAREILIRARSPSGRWSLKILDGPEARAEFPAGALPAELRASGVDRAGREGSAWTEGAASLPPLP